MGGAAVNTQKVLLGALLVYPEFAPYALPELELSQFAPDVQPVFAAVAGFWEKEGTLEPVQVCARYPEKKPEILSCVDEFNAALVRPNRERVEKWTRIIREQAALNRFQSLAIESTSALTTFEDLSELYRKMGEVVTLDRETDDFQTFGDCLDDYIRKLGEQTSYIPTGIPALDKYLNLSPGNLFLIGGRPSAGKTALSLQIAVKQARLGFKVCYFSLETDPATLTKRIIANYLGEPLASVKAKSVPQEALDRLAKLHRIPLYIRSASGKDVGWIKGQVQRMKPQIVVIDYLQLLRDGNRGRSRYEAVTNISMALHELAQTTGVVVIALSQLSRSAAGGAPSNADLRDSGQLEQDADAILLLSDDGETYQAVLSKNKEGQVGKIPLAFEKTTQRFLPGTARKGA